MLARTLPTVLALPFAGCGPISFVPGVRLGGTEVPTPDSWSAVEIPDEVQLRAGGGVLPRVVNIWAAKSGDGLYVSGEEGSGWAKRVASQPDVHLRLRDNVYAVRATRIDSEEDRRRVAEAFIAKYREEIREFTGEEPTPELLGEGNLVFRLDPR